MKGYVENIEQLTKENNNFRKVLYTAHYSQLVLMNLLPGEEIGEEVHGLDQFLRIESGTGKAVLDGVEHPIADGSAIVVPAGTRHNIINTSTADPMKLYTVYAPPDHEDAIIHITKADAIANDKPFNGKTTE
jgi:mannose-6-phosphate isomerase-like protein (cupin superfamily)